MNYTDVKTNLSRGLLVVAATLLTHQTAVADEPHARDGLRKTETVRVTAPRNEVLVVSTQVGVDTAEIIERLQRALAEDFERDVEAIGNPQIELVIAEVPTRG